MSCTLSDISSALCDPSQAIGSVARRALADAALPNRTGDRLGNVRQSRSRLRERLRTRTSLHARDIFRSCPGWGLAAPASARRRRYTVSEPIRMLSINIQPTRGGVAPLYRPRTPSRRTVCVTHCSGPLKRVLSVVWSRTLIVSNGWPTVRFVPPQWCCISLRRLLSLHYPWGKGQI